MVGCMVNVRLVGWMNVCLGERAVMCVSERVVGWLVGLRGWWSGV